MRSSIISILLCILVLGATLWLIFKAPIEPADPQSAQTKEDEIPTEEVQTEITRAYVIETAHDTEDLIERLAYSRQDDYKKALDDLIRRLSASAAYLKDSLKDYYGATYFTKLSELFQDIAENPFTDSATFSQRTAKMLTELENAYPADQAAANDENDPVNPMYYPKLDTEANGKTTLAMLALFRLQYQDSTGAMLITLGGNMVPGDTLLGAEKSDSFKALQEKSKYPYPLYKLSSILSTDSSSFANLEAPLTDAIGDSVAAGSVKGLKSYAALLKNGGIDAVSIANSSVLSFGQSGKEDTKKALNEAKLLFSDEGTVVYHQTSLGTVAYLTYDIIDEIGADKNLTYAEAPKQDIEAAKNAGAKFVVVCFNWINTEKNSWDPCMSQILTARAAVDNGANLVLGTHTGNLEAIEQYNGVSIVYSTGELFNRGSGITTSFLFQQAFTLDTEGKPVPGQIFVVPINGAGSEEGVPSVMFDASDVEAFRKAIVNASSTVRYGVGKKASFTSDHLNLITIEK